MTLGSISTDRLLQVSAKKPEQKPQKNLKGLPRRLRIKYADCGCEVVGQQSFLTVQRALSLTASSPPAS